MHSMEYRVRLGDTLFKIARHHGVAMNELARVNDIDNVNILWVGQKLRIPLNKPMEKNEGGPGVAETDGAGRQTNVIQTVDATLQAASSRIPEQQGQAESLFVSGKEVLSYGRVRSEQGANLRDSPSATGLVHRNLPFNTRIFISRELPGEWYFVTLADGGSGYVYCEQVSTPPPEPHAILHKVKRGEGALQIVKQHYKRSALVWGQDERYYTNVLVEANRSGESSGIYKPDPRASWEQTRTRENHLIWVPSLEYARSLRERVPSGSITYETWEAVKRTAETVGDFALGSSAFLAGLIHGALESVWDLLTGLVDLVELVWSIIQSIFAGDIISDLKALWHLVESLTLQQLVDAGLNIFLGQWNDESHFLRKWHFRGWVIGYAIAEIAMAVITGAAALVKWAGKAGRLSKLLAKFPKVMKLAEKVSAASARIPDSVLRKVKSTVSSAKARVEKKIPSGKLPETPKRLPAERPDKTPSLAARALKYESLSEQIRRVYKPKDVAEVLSAGVELGLSDKQIIDFLEMGSIAKPGKKPPKLPLTVGALQEQMHNWVKVIRPRGFPYHFDDLKTFRQFQTRLKKLLKAYGIPDGRMVIQGSSLRTPLAKDIDVAIFVSDDAFAQYANRCSKGISARAKTDRSGARIARDLDTQLAKGFIPKYYFDRVRPEVTFGNELRSLIEDAFKIEIDLSVMRSSSKLDLYPSLEF